MGSKARRRAALVLSAGLVGFTGAGCAVKRAETELTRSECEQMVRTIDRLRSEGTGGLDLVKRRSETASIERCLETGTERAYRCIRHAASAADLPACEELYAQ